MKFFRPDLHHDALRRLAALHTVFIRKKAIAKVVKKPEEKKVSK